MILPFEYGVYEYFWSNTIPYLLGMYDSFCASGCCVISGGNYNNNWVVKHRFKYVIGDIEGELMKHRERGTNMEGGHEEKHVGFPIQ